MPESFPMERDSIFTGNAEHKTELPNRIGKHFFARLHNCGNRLSVEVSKDGEEWTVFQ